MQHNSKNCKKNCEYIQIYSTWQLNTSDSLYLVEEYTVKDKIIRTPSNCQHYLRQLKNYWLYRSEVLTWQNIFDKEYNIFLSEQYIYLKSLSNQKFKNMLRQNYSYSWESINIYTILINNSMPFHLDDVQRPSSIVFDQVCFCLRWDFASFFNGNTFHFMKFFWRSIFNSNFWFMSYIFAMGLKSGLRRPW